MASHARGFSFSELSSGQETRGMFDGLAQAIVNAMSPNEPSSPSTTSNQVDLTLESSANTSLLALTESGVGSGSASSCLDSSGPSKLAVRAPSHVAQQGQVEPLTERVRGVTSDSVINCHSELATVDRDQARSAKIAKSVQPTSLAYQSVDLLSQTGTQFEDLESVGTATLPCSLAPDLDFTNGNGEGTLIPGLNRSYEHSFINQTNEIQAPVQHLSKQPLRQHGTIWTDTSLNQAACLDFSSSDRLPLFPHAVHSAPAVPGVLPEPFSPRVGQISAQAQSLPASFDPRAATNYAFSWPQGNVPHRTHHQLSGSGYSQSITPAQSPQFSFGQSSPGIWSPTTFQAPWLNQRGSIFSHTPTSGYPTGSSDSRAGNARLTERKTREKGHCPKHHCSHKEPRLAKQTPNTRPHPAGTGSGTQTLRDNTFGFDVSRAVKDVSGTRNASIGKRGSQLTNSSKGLMDHRVGRYQQGTYDRNQARYPVNLQASGHGNIGGREAMFAQFSGDNYLTSNQLSMPPAAQNQVLDNHPGAMNSRKRGRVVSTAEAYPAEKYARGASPTRFMASTQALPGPQGYNYSFPTVPNARHFGNLTSLKPDTGISYNPFPGHNAFRPGYEDAMQSDHLSTTTFDQESMITSPTQISHPGSSQLNATFGSDEWGAGGHFDAAFLDQCSNGCDAASCSVEQCVSCHSGCSDECSDPSQCSSVTCRNPSCLPSPEPLVTNAQGVSQDLMSQPFNVAYDCDWVGNGVNCEHSGADPDQLRQHVIESHVIPQRNRTCQWNGCTATVDVQDLQRHVFEDHRSDETTVRFGCLWEQCNEKFTSADELDVHFKYAHCSNRPECHSGGCDVVTMSEIELRNHIFESHMNMNAFEADDVEDTTMLEYSVDQPGFEPPQSRIDAEEHQANASASSPGALSGQLADLMGAGRKSEVLGQKQCMWTTYGIVCGYLFDNGNDLHEHIKNTHGRAPDTPNSHDLRCEWQGCDYIESTKDRSKLWRHMATHTKYALAACLCHGKEFADKHRLDDHLRKNTRERPFRCDTCGSCFSHVHALTIHKRTHSGEKPLKCTQCDYQCGDPSNMSKHRKTHGAPQHECLTCHKKFGRKETLKRHLSIHDPDKAIKRRKPGPKPGK